MTADPAGHYGDYDDYAAEYRILAERRDRAGVDGDPMGILPRLLDAVASYLVLGDVRDYRGFIATIGAVLKPGGRMVVALNNPYGAVIRKHVADYFASGTADPYRAFWKVGIKAYFYHRTLEEYVEEFAAARLSVTRLADLPTMASGQEPDTILPAGFRFPRFMLLALVKAG